MSKAHNFRELKIWKESMESVKAIYSVTSQLPKEEKFGLVSQINRCAVFIPSNIAISSSYELESQLILIQDIFNCETVNHVKNLQSIQLKLVPLREVLALDDGFKVLDKQVLKSKKS